MLSIFTVLSIIMVPISWIYVRKIDFMKTNYPDYEGKDLI